MDYVPLSSVEGLPSPHGPPPSTRNPWSVWLIALAHVPPLVTLMLVGSTSHLATVLVFVVVLVGTTVGCVALARREAQPNPWLAIVPAAYLLARASTRGSLYPLLLNLLLGFIAGYYVVLFLAAIVQIVNIS